MAIFDQDFACDALAIESMDDAPAAIEQRAITRHHEYASRVGIRGAVALIVDIVREGGPSLSPVNRFDLARRVMECYMGFDPTREVGHGYEPPRAPNGFDDDPIAFTSEAIDIAIDLMVHPDGLDKVVERVAADILLSTRGRDKWKIRVGKGKKDEYFPAENDIARARRMLEAATTILRKEA